MGNDQYRELFVHLVWATWSRRPLITAALEPELFRVLHEKSAQLRCDVIAIGAAEDHVHALTRLDAAASVARLVGELKGCSSHAMTHRICPGSTFAWQAGYAAFTVSTADVPDVSKYVVNQRERHHRRTLEKHLELPFD